MFEPPPPTVLSMPLARLERPPLTTLNDPLAVLTSPPPTELAQGAGGFQPTHRVIAAGDTAEGPVVIAVPPDFPLDDIRLLIERAP